MCHIQSLLSTPAREGNQAKSPIYLITLPLSCCRSSNRMKVERIRMDDYSLSSTLDWVPSKGGRACDDAIGSQLAASDGHALSGTSANAARTNFRRLTNLPYAFSADSLSCQAPSHHCCQFSQAARVFSLPCLRVSDVLAMTDHP